LIAALIVVAGAVLWVVARQPPSRRTDLSTYGAFAVAFVALVGGWIVYLARKRQPGGADQGQALDELADSFAKEVKKLWDKQARERELLPPIPVLWKGLTRQLTGPISAAVGWSEFEPLPDLPAVGAEQLRGGEIRGLHAVYGGLRSGRLVIVGPPGSGKTGAAIVLIRTALDYRAVRKKDRKRVPVPVLFPLHGWNPGNQPVQAWLADQLQQNYPQLFAGKGGRSKAAALVAAGKIAVILDGLDEIPEQLRPVALQALSDQADFRLVVLGRSDEMAAAAAAREKSLAGAVALELQDVDAEIAADYLTSVQLDPPPDHWRELISRLRNSPDSPIARALSTPLTLTLVRDTYGEGDDVRELLEYRGPAGLGASRENIEDYLLDRVLHAAYKPHPGKDLPYEFETAQQALGRIAARMNQDGTRDLAWWRISAWASRTPRGITTGLLAAVVCGLAGKLGFGLVGLIVGIVFGFGFGFGFGAGPEDELPMRMAPQWRKLLRHSTAAYNLAAGIAAGIVSGFVFGFVFGIGFGLAAGIAVGIAVGIVVVVLVAMYTIPRMWKLVSQPAPDTPNPLTPRTSWRSDRALTLVTGLGAGVGWGILTSGTGWHAFAPVAVAVMLGLIASKTWPVSLTFVQLAPRWHTPVRLMRFLEDAHERGVLRTVGPVYQFRHARLQDRLAEQASATRENLGEGTVQAQ